eukprot:Hpha_TRINITY_DN1902_c0_g1::TRINITY_DN1902_c0_g1_i1::g.30947::m.30947/K08835/OXSR1, STK39; serine/threonine-protein kinase OSR1/STK39
MTDVFPNDPSAYELLAEVGHGATAVVYRARCIPLDKEVAVKIINLDNTRIAIEQFQREITIMSRSAHPNVLKLHASFSKGKHIWLILEYHPYGSIADVIKSISPEGFENEKLVAAMLYQATHALNYFHENGQMHRDVKASNLLLSSGGEVRLADFGVSSDAPSCRRSMTRVTFVGTPCWMAPEVLTLRGYRKSADIWSLGITALELAFGQPPNAQHPPMKVMALTLKADPPTVDQCRDNKFSAVFKDFVAQCLRKDPGQRPSTVDLIKHPLFMGLEAKESAAAEAVKEFVKAWDIPTLQQHPVRPIEISMDVGDDDDGDRAGSPVDEWDFPAGMGEGLDDLAGWKLELHGVHASIISNYTKVAQLVQLEDLTISSASSVKSEGTFALHELAVDRDRYVEPLLKDDIVTSVLGLSGPGIVPCREVWEDGERALYWVTDHIPGGSLAQHVRQVGPIRDDAQVADIMRTLAAVLAHLHKQGICLKRLSSLTVLVEMYDGGLNPMIDLSSIMLVPGGIKFPDAMPEAYMPAEQFDDKYDAKVDIYALGMICLEILTGKQPYAESRNAMKLVQQKIRGIQPAGLSTLDDRKDWQDFIRLLTVQDPADRPDAVTVFQQPVLRRR